MPATIRQEPSREKTMKIVSLLIIALLCLPTIQTRAVAQDKPQNATPLKTKFKKDELSARLESLIPRLMNDGDVPGLSIAVVRDSEVFWHRAFGVKNAETKEACRQYIQSLKPLP